MPLFLSLFLPALAADCEGGSCPAPHNEPVPTAVVGAKTNPPPLDLLPPTHLRTATFALG